MTVRYAPRKRTRRIHFTTDKSNRSFEQEELFNHAPPLDGQRRRDEMCGEEDDGGNVGGNLMFADTIPFW